MIFQLVKLKRERGEHWWTQLQIIPDESTLTQVRLQAASLGQDDSHGARHYNRRVKTNVKA